MAKRQKAETKATVTRGEGQSIVINQMTVAQITRGNQDVQKWFQAVKSAESTMMPNRRALYNTYLDVSIDLHLDMLMDKRIRAVKTTPFEWQGIEADDLIENFRSPWFADLLTYIQQRIFWGTTLVEFMLGDDGLISKAELIPRQNVKPEKGIISLDGVSDSGILYREGIYLNYILQVGKDNELGKLSKLAPYVLMKRMNLADFSRYNEMFAMPLRVYKYNVNQPGAREEVEAQAKAHGSAAYIVLPDGMGSVEFQDSVKQSTAFAYDKFHGIMNDEMTIGILGQSLTTGGEGGGSYELGRVHKAVEAAINLEDRLIAEYILNYPMKRNILIPHGYPLEGITGKFKVSEEIPKDKMMTLFTQLYQSGAPIAEEDFYQIFGIDPPGGRPVVVGRSGDTPPQPGQGDDIPDPDGGGGKPTPPAPGKKKPDVGKEKKADTGKKN